MSVEKSTYDAFQKSPYLSSKHSTYFDVYDRLFARYVGKPIVFVEIGVFSGGSLFMWQDYFGKDAIIIGIDLNPNAKNFEQYGFEIHIGDQADDQFWVGFYEEIHQRYGGVDILLDDGGHTFEQQIITVASSIPWIRDNGLIVVEDTHTSYFRKFGGPSSTSFISYAKNIVDGINYRFSKFRKKGMSSEQSIFGISFYESFVVFEIDRDKAAIRSRPIDNNGKKIMVQDYRYTSSKVINFFGQSKNSYFNLPKLSSMRPIMRPFFLLFRKVAMKIKICADRIKLKKYFNY